MFSDQIFLREIVVKESTDKVGEAYIIARKKGRRGRRKGKKTRGRRKGRGEEEWGGAEGARRAGKKGRGKGEKMSIWEGNNSS